MHGISRTAAYVAAGRALGAREPDRNVANPDYLAERLLGDPARFDLDLPLIHALKRSYEEAMADIEIAGVVRAMIVRTRFIDDALERAVASGAEQVMILGAGFDSHAYRFAPLLKDLRVFEVDRPQTQAYKRERVRDVVGPAPANLTYVPVRFEQESLSDALNGAGYDFARRSFVIMEGVTMYLTDPELRGTLALLATHAAGSSVAFDFVSSAMIALIKAINLEHAPPAVRGFAERFLHLTRDEPWESGLPLRGEREYLEAFGLEVPEILDVGGEQAIERFLTRGDGTTVGGEALRRIPPPTSEGARRQAEAMAYRIAEAVVAVKH
jgi:methyltransferase (TIGR00027 family)